MSRLRSVIAETERSSWIVSTSYDGRVPFKDEVSTKKRAWIAAKEAAELARPGDTVDAVCGAHCADGLSPDAFVDWLRERWR